MTTHVVTVTEDTSIGEIADLMLKHRVKRLPVVSNETVVGIVSRGDPVQALAKALRLQRGAEVVDAAAVREAIIAELERQPRGTDRNRRRGGRRNAFESFFDTLTAHTLMAARGRAIRQI